jgi:CHAT domain-containing protein/tetratricopeptide (TPR) repeat protein
MSRLLFVALTLPVAGICLATVEAGLRKEESKASQARETPPAPEAGPALAPSERQQRLKERDRYAQEAATLAAAGKLAEAVAAAEKMLALERQLFGDVHEEVAGSLQWIAQLQERREDFAAARQACREVLTIRRKLDGPGHWRVADARLALEDLERRSGMTPAQRQRLGEASRLNGVAGILHRRGKFREAVQAAQQALAIRKEALGDKHPHYAAGLNNLAFLYKEMGDSAKAEPLYRQALDIDKEALGDKHPGYAICLNNLAGLYEAMGDYAKAEPLYRQALDIKKEALGGRHPSYATSLNNLAGLYQAMGEYAQAEPHCRQALAICKEALGEKHPHYAAGLNNLAGLYEAMGDYAKAEPLYRQALDIDKEALGDKHPDYATSLNNLALLYRSMGDYAKAESLSRQALAVDKEALGDKHPSYAMDLNNLALLYRSMGDYAKSEPLYRQALDITRQSLQLTASVQSERQQLSMGDSLRYQLDGYLSAVVQAQAKATLPGDTTFPTLYGHVLAWKGAVFMQQHRQRLARSHPELTPLFDKLQDVSRRLATRALATPAPQQRQAWQQDIADLTHEKEKLESELAGRCAAFDRDRQLARLTAKELQAVLPADAVLLDFLDYWHSQPDANKPGKLLWERHLAAFMVRRGRPLVLKDLGPVTDIAQAVERWRRSIAGKGDGRGGGDPAGTLRRRLWQPLAEAVGDAAIVLVSPDGVLGTFPFAALPGDKDERYLIEERAVAAVAVPQLLPELLRPDPKDKRDMPPSLLLVGDVDFGAAPGLAAARGSNRTAIRGSRAGALMQFNRLEATREEIVAVSDSFRRGHRRQKTLLTELREDEATEAAVRSQAPKHRYLHFATHGFFAPSVVRSALAPAPSGKNGPAAEDLRGPDLFGRRGISGFHPGLLSGLALAGANRPVATNLDDGILTALEVAELDLSGVELAALSACETGLGETAGGEGLLGLQRAFQTAGARSVVASLWQVDDEATRKLMVRFYEGLWRAKEPLGKLAALREAQLWMLREGVKRGLVRLTEEEASAKPSRTPPYFWAAFVLSGDWR